MLAVLPSYERLFAGEKVKSGRKHSIPTGLHYLKISNRLSTERWTWTAHRESREQTGCSCPSTERPNGD
jgi:hypothetical protein